MPLPIYTNDALENWKRYGGDQAAVQSYVAKAGSAANLTPPATVEAPAAPGTTAPTPAAPSIPAQNVAPQSMDASNAALKQNPFAVATPSADTLGRWVDQNRPTDPGAYKGDAPQSMHWGGALIGGSNTGIEQYKNWQGQKDMYNQALQKWQQEYAAWQQQKSTEEKMRMRVAPSAEPQTAQPIQQSQSWGTPTKDYVAPSQSPQNPYAPPGQRTPAAQPGAGPVQKPDRSASKVNERYAGVL